MWFLIMCLILYGCYNGFVQNKAIYDENCVCTEDTWNVTHYHIFVFFIKKTKCVIQVDAMQDINTIW